MKKLMILSTAAAVLGLFPANRINAATEVYDLKGDWSDAQNPNGTWSYLGPSFGLLSDDPFPWAWSHTSGMVAITKTTEVDAVPGALEVGDIYGGITGLFQVGVRWTAPADGNIDVSGGIWNTCSSNQAVVWELFLNRSPFSYGNSAGSSRSAPTDFSESTFPYGADELLNIAVQAGDQVDLVCRISDSCVSDIIVLGASTADSFDDSFGINFTVTFTPDAVDPLTAIEDLALTVVEMNLQNGIENSLDSKLDAVLTALLDANENNDDAACNSLSAFTNSVEAQRDKMITSAQADQLIAAAQEIRALLNCGN